MLHLWAISLLIFQMYLLSSSEMTWLLYIDIFSRIKIFFISCSFKQGSSMVLSVSKGYSHGNLVFYTGLFPFQFCSIMMCTNCCNCSYLQLKLSYIIVSLLFPFELDPLCVPRVPFPAAIPAGSGGDWFAVNILTTKMST